MDFLALLKQLTNHEVKFVIVGGYASTILGNDLLTQDLDVCVDLGSENMNRLYNAIADLNPRNRMDPTKRPIARAEATASSIKNLYLLTDLGPLDCLGSILGLGDFNSVQQYALQIELEFGPIQTLNFEGLIKAKSELGREKDRLTIQKLQAIREKLREQQGEA